MFDALIELGNRLEEDGKLPSPGFYAYGEPIEWTVYVGREPEDVYLEKSDLRLPRPFSGRTSAPEEHLLADEAVYALGVSRQDDGGVDQRAESKHRRFHALVESFRDSVSNTNPALHEATGWLVAALDRRAVESDRRFGDIDAKAWVSFVPNQGALAGQHLFDQPEAKAYWLAEMQRRVAAHLEGTEQPVIGACSSCGRENQLLVRKLPLGVKLVGNTPLHSLNADAFTSYVGGVGTSKRAHLGLCFECGDTAARAFNYLSNSDRHRRTLYRHPRTRDSLANMIALFWTKAPALVLVGDQELDLDLIDVGSLLDERPNVPDATLSQLVALLDLPWKPSGSAFRLDTYAFYVAILSPNVGRIAVRDWIAVSLDSLLESLRAFVQAGRVVALWGERVEPVSIATIFDGLGESNADLHRALVRSAFQGVPPPLSLAVEAGQRLRHLYTNEASLKERQRARSRDQAWTWSDRWLTGLASAIKLALYYGKEEARTMERVNPLHQSPAYHCGRLLAMLEQTQQDYTYAQYEKTLDTTLVGRGYGGASTAPATAFPPLVRLAVTAHLTKCGDWENAEVERIMSTIADLGRFPETLTLVEQADFGLGFFQQRSRIRTHHWRLQQEKEDKRQQGDKQPVGESA